MWSGRRLAWTLLFVFLSTAWLSAQLNRGSIEGIVTDPQGGVIPGVAVTITNVDTGVAAPTKTDTAGLYRVVSLVPGTYRVRFNAQGFSPVDFTSISVPAGEVVRVDTALKLGSTQSTVEVTAGVPLVETEAANFSTSLEGRMVQDVPLNGRDVQQLTYLLPGVNPVSGPPGSTNGFNSEFGTFPDPTHVLGSALSVNGGQAGANAWYLDGNLNLSSLAENMAVSPSQDAISEFQAVTNAFAPEYSRTGGAVFSIVLKSGTNNFHGDAYEYLRNDATNARNPFTSVTLNPLTNQPTSVKDRQLRFNNFGGTIGGPVILPGYNGKNKTFFFVSGEATILHLLGENRYTVPTKRMRTGDFSEDPNAVAFGLWDPYSSTNQAFAGPNSNLTVDRVAFGTPTVPNGCNASYIDSPTAVPSSCQFSTQIPSQRLDPVAMYFINSFPLPNYFDPLSGCPLDADNQFGICSNYLASVGSSQDPYNFSVKIDHQFTEKNRWFGEWLYNPVYYRNYRVPWTGPTFPMDSSGWGSTYPFNLNNTIIALGNTYTFNPTFINEGRISYSRQILDTNPAHPYSDSINAQTQVQQTLAPLQIPEDPYFPTPNWGISTPGGGNITFGPTTWVNMKTGSEALNLLDNVTKIMGRHTFKTGFLYRLEHTVYNSGFPTGFGFGGELAQNPGTSQGGSGLAQFMMGAVATGGRGSFTGVMWKPHERFRYWGLYGQDDFRITPNFTLDFGLRWDFYGLYKTKEHPMSNFCLSCPNSITGLPGKVIYEGSPEFPTGSDIAPTNKSSIAPRLNFSWAPFGGQKTVIRGGYDIFYSNAFASINSPGQSAANAPGWNQEFDWNGSFYSQCPPFTGQCVAFPLQDTSTNKRGLTTPPMPPSYPAVDTSSAGITGFPDIQVRDMVGIGVMQFFTPPSHDPMIENWNLEIERQLPGNMMVGIGYVGTHGTHLVGETFRQFDYVHTADKLKYRSAYAFNNSVDASQFYSGQTLALLEAVYGTPGNPQLPLQILLKPYPFYGALSTLQNNTAFDGTSVYHGLNVKLQKQYSHGLDFLVAYTFSKKITNAMAGQTSAMLVDPIHWSTKSGLVGGRAGELAWNGGFGGSFQDPDNKKADRAIAADDITHILNVATTYELPFGAGRRFLNRHGVVNGAVGGWRLTGNFNAEGGLPMPISGPCNSLTCRPNLVGDPNFSGSRTRQQQINQWVNPSAFQPVFGTDQNFWLNFANGTEDPNDDRLWRFANMGPRLANFRTPGFWNLDTSLAKQFHLTESRYAEFRWEVFNALNHQNLGLPNGGYCLPPGPNGEIDAVRQTGCQFGRITNIATDPRTMQFALKFYW